MELNDKALVVRWRAGDRAVLALIAQRYAPALGAVAYGIVGDASLCDDVVQETFARAASGLDRLNHDGKLGGYLVGIARNVATDMVRRRSQEQALAENGQTAPGMDPATPESDAVRAEMRRQLDVAVAALPEDQRELFLMKYVSGLRYREIAQALGTTEVAVSQKLFRIRRKLQQDLKEFKP